jgi:hypothetical protein
MSHVTTQQLAQVLLGVARAQQAIIEALENSKAGFKATHFRPAVEAASRIRTNRPETLTEYPSRLLLHMLGRTAPDLDTVLRDLERLLGPSSATQSSPATSAPEPTARVTG